EACRHAILQTEDRVRCAQRARSGDLCVRKNNEWWVETQQSLSSEAVRVVVEHAVAAADYSSWSSRVREAHPRCEVVAIRLDQCLIPQRPFFCEDELPRRRIEVGPFELPFARRGCEFIAQPEIQSQLARNLPIVLQEDEIHVLIDLESRIRILLIAGR